MVYFFGITSFSNIYMNDTLIIELKPDTMADFWDHFNHRNIELQNMNSEHILQLHFLWQPLNKPVPFIPVINKTYLIKILQKKFKKYYKKISHLRKLKNLQNREIGNKN